MGNYKSVIYTGIPANCFGCTGNWRIGYDCAAACSGSWNCFTGMCSSTQIKEYNLEKGKDSL